jgi:hypothetical protein
VQRVLVFDVPAYNTKAVIAVKKQSRRPCQAIVGSTDGTATAHLETSDADMRAKLASQQLRAKVNPLLVLTLQLLAEDITC